ncbi:MAG: two-component sensor histidine kinase [Glaciimonas sp.]|nr:two-component sensor histidine kinase [Glaciimonas sp.]
MVKLKKGQNFHINSLRRRLLLWLLPAAFLVGVLASIGTYWGALIELEAQLNDQMRYIAEHVSVQGGGQVTMVDTDDQKKHDNDDKADEVLLQVWSNGQLQFTTNAALRLPAPTAVGLHDVLVGARTWHTYVSQRGDKLIRAAQAKDARWEALASLAVHLFWPVLSLVPLLALFIWFGIGYGLRPLQQIASELAQRNVKSMAPIATDNLPGEVRPLVSALNDLLQRLDQAYILQKSFIADAAHELRTPVMALSIHAELAQRASNEEERQAALVQLQHGITRLTHLAQQLLTLARLEPEAQLSVPLPVELSGLCKMVIMDQIRSAEAKHIDLGLDHHETVVVAGDPANLRILLNNLVDNAIRYTKPLGKIDLAVHQDALGVVLDVCDNGPGIPEAERAQVWGRFYRGGNRTEPGSGLGLSIVKRIAEQHGALVSVNAGPEGKGLWMRVRFPHVVESDSVPSSK